MFSENQGIIITVLLVITICVLALVGVIYTFIITLQDLKVGTISALKPDREINMLEKEINYNFALPQETTEEKEIKEEEEKDEEKKLKVKAEDIQVEKKEILYNFNFPIPDKKVNPGMKSIAIPSIDYNSPIIISDDGNSAVDYGAWHYPSNHPLDGEAIFLCHRRYFKSSDPKSCWDLDKVHKGDSLFITLKDGTQLYYKIDSIAVTEGSDINIYHTSNDKRVKLISCAKENGLIGSNSHRIVVIATIIE